MKCLGIDPALRNCGIVLTEYNGSSHEILGTNVFKTKSYNKKTSKFSSGEHDFMCSSYQFGQLKEYITLHKPELIAVEIGSGSKGHRALAALNSMKGFMGSIHYTFSEAKWILIKPSEAKKIVVDYADKDLIMAYVRKKYPDYCWPQFKNVMEHIADAVIVLEAAIKKANL